MFASIRAAVLAILFTAGLLVTWIIIPFIGIILVTILILGTLYYSFKDEDENPPN